LTDEERKQRLNKQKADSKQRKKQKAMVSEEGEHVLFTPSAAASSDVVALANEYVYTASVQKIIQEQKKVRRSGPKKKKQWNILWLNERGAGRNRQGFVARTPSI
jgi:hypothetical protein